MNIPAEDLEHIQQQVTLAALQIMQDVRNGVSTGHPATLPVGGSASALLAWLNDHLIEYLASTSDDGTSSSALRALGALALPPAPVLRDLAEIGAGDIPVPEIELSNDSDVVVDFIDTWRTILTAIRLYGESAAQGLETEALGPVFMQKLMKLAPQIQSGDISPTFRASMHDLFLSLRGTYLPMANDEQERDAINSIDADEMAELGVQVSTVPLSVLLGEDDSDDTNNAATRQARLQQGDLTAAVDAVTCHLERGAPCDVAVRLALEEADEAGLHRDEALAVINEARGKGQK